MPAELHEAFDRNAFSAEAVSTPEIGQVDRKDRANNFSPGFP